jgi:hypothetical protein
MSFARTVGTALSVLQFWMKAVPNGHCDTAESLLDLAFPYRGVGVHTTTEVHKLARLVWEMRRKALLEVGSGNGCTLFLLCRTGKAYQYRLGGEGRV